MSMNCKKAEEYLVDYLYQELQAKKTLEIEKHLRSCPQCAKTLESWRAIHRAYQRNAFSEEPQIAPYFKQKILAVAEEELSRSPSWTERLIFAVKVATVPLAIFVIVLFLNEPKKMAMQRQQPEPVAPATKSEVARDVQQKLETPLAGERKQDSTGFEAKRSEADYVDNLKARPYDQRLDKDLAEKNKEAGSDAPAGRIVANEQAAAPPMSAPAEEVQQHGAQTDYEQSKTEAAALKKGRIAETADDSYRRAKEGLDRNDIQEWRENSQRAVLMDNKKTLASDFYAAGNTYQSRGEYGKAIAQYKLLQSNYRDYPQMDDVLLRLGDSLAEVGEFDEAVKTYRQVSPSQRRVATERIQRLQKKQEAQKQLRSLGYVSSDKDKE